MTPSLYETISQGSTLMSITARKAQEECDNPEKVKFYAEELQKTVKSLLKVPDDNFTSEGVQRYKTVLSEIDTAAKQLSEKCNDSENVMEITGRDLKPLFIQLGDILKSERPEIRGKSFWETIKEHFKK